MDKSLFFIIFANNIKFNRCYLKRTGSCLDEPLATKALEKGFAWVPTIYVYENSVEYMKRVTPNPTKADLVGIKRCV